MLLTIILKVAKRQDFTLSVENKFLEISQGGGGDFLGKSSQAAKVNPDYMEIYFCQNSMLKVMLKAS